MKTTTLLLCSALLAFEAFGNTLRYDFSFPEGAPDAEVAHVPGRPMVPVVRKRILIPYAQGVANVRFEAPRAVRAYSVAPASLIFRLEPSGGPISFATLKPLTVGGGLKNI